MEEKQSQKKKQLNSYVKYSSLTTQMVIIIITGVFSGDFLDDYYHSKTPIYTIILSLLSIFLALYYILKKIINYNEKK